MRIEKSLNNNVAVVLDGQGAEKIVMGKGICFRKKAGDEIDPEMVDKIFYLAEPEAAGDPVFLERVARRFLGLPWVIAQTDRLRIREFTEQDWRQVPADECQEEADQVFCRPELLRAYIRSQYRFYEYGIWAVEERDTGRLAGKAGVTNPQGLPEGETAVLELGYHIFRPYRRRGFGTEACRAIEAYVREEMPCRVCAKIDASNEASIRTALSCGLQFTGQIYSEAGRRMCLYAGNWTAR